VLLLNWKLFVGTGEFAWIFPPVRIIPEVIQLMERFKINCILVVPEQQAANWWICLFSLPLSHEIRQNIIRD
jgi:hypothetical protein